MTEIGTDSDGGGDNRSSHDKQLGRYRIDAVLGQGSMGVVYRGFDQLLERAVALKTVHVKLLDSENRRSWLERFRHEALAVGRCQHPSIVAVYDYGEQQGRPYIAMEYVDGVELQQRLRQGRFSPAKAIDVVEQVLDALHCAHSNGVIHRDIKPANVLERNDGQGVKITDFGVARLDTSNLTATGIVLGTPCYMAPELLRGKKLTASADVYACGVLLYELLAGRPPFVGDTTSQIIRRVLQEAPVFRGEDWRIVPTLRGVLNQALAKDPQRRYASVGEFAGVLRRLRDLVDDDD